MMIRPAGSVKSSALRASEIQAKRARAVRAFATGARSERKQSTKQFHQSAVLILLKVGQSERDPARPEKCAVLRCHVHREDRSHPQTLSEGDAPPRSATKILSPMSNSLLANPFGV